MSSPSVYIGIDVACAMGKRLPICAVSPGRPLLPLTIPKRLAALIPRGVGNAAVAARTGWSPLELESKLNEAVPGSRHDRLDAFMAAWVASLPRDQRRAIGDADQPDDAIWVPL